VTPIFVLALAALLLTAFGFEYLLNPKYWWLAFRLHVVVPLKKLRGLEVRKLIEALPALWRCFFGPRPRCCYEGCSRSPAWWEPRYGFFCRFHADEFLGDCADLAK
jgi:hypothetical protein